MSETLMLVLAAVPIVVLIVLLALRVKPLPAVLGAIGALVLLGFWFPIGGTELAAMSGRLTEVTLNVVFILLGGLLLSAYAADSGAQTVMSRWFESVAHTPERAILMYGLGLTPFIEATIGWGVSLIIAIPLLIRAGLSGTRAAAVGLLGLVVCPWGSLGPGMMLTAELGGVGLNELGVQASLYNLPVILSAALFIGVIGVGKRMTVSLAFELLGAALALWIVLLAVNATLGPALGGIFGGVAVILVLLLCARVSGARHRLTVGEAKAFAPFVVLVVAMLAMIGLAAVVDLGAWEGLATSPGLWLVVSAATAPYFYGMRRGDVAVSTKRGTHRWIFVTITTVSYIVFGMLLSVSGMSAQLADGAASSGAVFVYAIPFVGLLAGYLTASITSVATMLTLGVTDAAVALGLDPAAALGAQTAAAGSAVGASPSRLVLATSVAEESVDGAAPTSVHYGKVALVTLAMSGFASILISLAMWIFPLG